MNDRDIEKLIKNEFDAAAPDDFDAILKKLGEAPPEENNAVGGTAKITKVSSNGRPRRWKYGLLAAMLAIVICTGIFGYRAVKLPADIVQLDVNPSIELTLNSFGRVLECRAINTDADPITASFKLEGKTLPYAAEKLTAALVKAGYVAENKNSILVSVMSSSQRHADTLAEKAAAAIVKAAQNAQVNAAVLTQALSDAAVNDSSSQELGISAGKTALVKSFKGCLPEYDENSMAKLSINDLGILAREYNNSEVKLAGTGTPSWGAYVSADAAGSAAKAAWLSAGISVESVSARITAENGKMLYIVRAENNAGLLIASVDAVTGKILDSALDESRYAVSPKPDASAQQNTQPEQSTDKMPPDNQTPIPENTPDVTTPAPTPPSVTPQPVQLIREQDALNAALAAFEVSGDTISDVKVDKEKHKGVYVYEVRFEKDTLDYKATVDAATGKVISMFIY